MKSSLLFLAALGVIILLHTLHQGQASELSELLEKGIAEVKDEIDKRGKKRPPCGFTWRCRRRRRGWGKRVRILKENLQSYIDRR